jgi:hypothetical protein
MLPMKNSTDARPMLPSPINAIAAYEMTPTIMKMPSSRFLMLL